MDGVEILCIVLNKVISVSKETLFRGRAGKKHGRNLIVQYYKWSKLIKAEDTPKEAYPTTGLSSLVCAFAWSLMLAAAQLHHELDQGADPAQK